MCCCFMSMMPDLFQRILFLDDLLVQEKQIEAKAYYSMNYAVVGRIQIGKGPSGIWITSIGFE